MQALQLNLEPGSYLKSARDSKYAQEINEAGNDSLNNKKFAEVFEQMLALPQTAAMESRVKPAGSQKESRQTAETAGERVLQPGSNRGKRLTGISPRGQIPVSPARSHATRLSGQAGKSGQTVGATDKTPAAAGRSSQTAAQVPGNPARPTGNAALRMAGEELKSVAAGGKNTPAAGKVSGNSDSPTRNAAAQITGEEFKSVTAGEKKAAAAGKVSGNSDGPTRNAAAQMAGEELKSVATGEKKTAAADKVSGNSDSSISNAATRLTGEELKSVATGRKKTTATGKVSGNSDNPASNAASRMTGEEFKSVPVGEKKTAAAVASVNPEVKGYNPRGKQTVPAEAERFQAELSNQVMKTGLNSSIPAAMQAEKFAMSKSQMDFIVSNLVGQIKSGISSLEINLKPEYLGKLKLLLQM
ncbi:MAG: flagellar hook-length control protein FliK, partial [Syntrophomonadaceae bacterium]|nr:flagellar hook-length control protein FliK [Syntrophomonadaceae bacterium]